MNIMSGNRQQHAVFTSLAADIRDNNHIVDRQSDALEESANANANAITNGAKVSCCGTFTRSTCFVDKMTESEVFGTVQKHNVHLLNCATDAGVSNPSFPWRPICETS